MGKPRQTLESFMTRVVKLPDAPGCWLWTGYLSPQGYGMCRLNGKLTVAHRVGLELLGLQCPDGMEADHRCRVRECVNPAHLEYVTHRENVRRGLRGEAMLTHCKNGHEYSPDNTGRYPCNDYRRKCRKCARIYWKRYEARKRAGLVGVEAPCEN